MSKCYLSDMQSKSKAEVGYLEKKTADVKYLYDKKANAGNKNNTKYAKDIYDKARKLLNGNKQGKSYCAVGLIWLVLECCDWDIETAKEVLCFNGSADEGASGAGVPYMKRYFKAKGRYDKTPKVGDFICFNYDGGEPDHIGFVRALDKTTVYTREWNTTKDGKGGVWDKSYSRSKSTIDGYCHPKYDSEPTPTPPTPPEPTPPKEEVMVENLIVVKKGVKGEQVKTVQRILKQMGFYTMSVDGSCGDGTVSAIKKFQKSKGLTQDGSCGQKTWDRLLKG